MKNFNSFLAPQLNEYLSYRQSLGYSTRVSRAYLLVFDQYLRKTNADWDSLQPFYFLEMRANLDIEPRSVNRVFSSVRVFFHFLLRREQVRENPLHDIPPLRENGIIPFVFSPGQTEQLLQAVCQREGRSEKHFLIDLSLYLAVVLLARCAMRISEPLKLMRNHYRQDDGTLYIEKTKFKKQRLIPVPRAAMTEIENYLSVRQSLNPHDLNPYLLAGKNLGPLKAEQVRDVFRSALKKIGLDQSRKVIGNMNFTQPTPHSLRHSFAVNTLIKIRHRGQSPQRALPVLAAYMGHSEYKYTSVYLRVADA
ncbi:MAG: tyrosine-type recombinase/integrase, partial [Pseudomonadota bacterium]